MRSPPPAKTASSQALACPSTPVAQLTVLPLGRTVPVAAGHSLLQAALAAGVQLPSSCRNGTCRACMCRLQAGQVRYRIDWPGLSAEEKAEGWVLPCVAVAHGPVTLAVPGAVDLLAHTPHRHDAGT